MDTSLHALANRSYSRLAPELLCPARPGPAKIAQTMAQYPTIREHREYRVHDFGAILPILSYCGILGHYLGDFGGPGIHDI